jgi:hypothetical protein
MNALARAFVTLALVPLAPVQALTVRSLETSYSAPAYRVTLVALVDAPPHDVESVLLDYPNYRRLDSRIRASEVLEGGTDDSSIVQTRIRFCAGWFCRTIDRVENVEHRPGELLATVIPERSELRRGVTRTEWRAEGNGTLVTYEAEFVPDFWVPDIIARRYATRALRESTARLFANVEREAHER